MNYLSVFDHLSGKRLAFLQNAYRIGYTLKANGLSSAVFTLPAADEKNALCQPFHFVEIFDGGESVGMFRILPSVFKRDAQTREITYRCEHAAATLMDDILFGWHELGNVGTNTTAVLRYLLDRQTVKRWQLAGCDFSHQFLYGWENENLLSALFSIPNPFPEEYRWEYRTQGTPWLLSLKKKDNRIKGEIRYRKNLTGITKTSDPTNLTTRLYALGYGEGENQLKLEGLPYLDADTQNQYGIISKIWVDRRYQDRASLLAAARSVLEGLKTPYVSYEITAVDAFGLNAIRIGDTIRVIDDEDGISFSAPVIELSKTDLTGQNTQIKITIQNQSKDLASTIADLSDRQRIADLYSQGSVNIDSHDFADNADAENPAAMRFYVPGEAIRINSVRLIYRIAPFRSYSRGVESAPGSSQTSSSGGGQEDTTSSGGGQESTTSSGGGQESTTRSGGGKSGSTGFSSNTSKATGRADYGGSGKMTLENHIHYFGIPTHDHSFQIESHSHEITIREHSHSVTIPAHSHNITIPAHNHSITIPAHNHEMEHGIFTGGQAASVRILVDGKMLPPAPENTDLDITGYLSADSAGKIARSAWHEVTLIPNTLTRIEASLQSTLFINPRGGQDK